MGIGRKSTDQRTPSRKFLATPLRLAILQYFYVYKVHVMWHAWEWPIKDGIKRSSVDVYKYSKKSVETAVYAVQVDAQTEFVSVLSCVETRTVNCSSAWRFTATSLYVTDRPHVRTHVLPTTPTTRSMLSRWQYNSCERAQWHDRRL